MARTLYQKFRDLWKDKPDKTTPVTAEALNHIEQGIYDNSANIVELGEIVDGVGAKDISSQCSINANGQIVEITIPIDGIAMNNIFIAGGLFLGLLKSNRPPMFVYANISVSKYMTNSVIDTNIEGTAELINTFASTYPQYGTVFDGNIEIVSLSQNSAITCAGEIKMTFDFGEITEPTYTIYKSSQYYYPITQLQRRIEALEQRISDLENI